MQKIKLITVLLVFSYLCIFAKSTWDKIELKSPLLQTLQDYGIDFDKKGVYDSVSVSAIVENIKKQVLEQGYVFAELTASLQQRDFQKILVIEIIPKKGFKFGKPYFFKIQTKNEILERYSQIKKGSNFSFTELEKSRQRLSRIPYFTRISLTQILRDSILNVLYPVFEIEESQQNHFEFSLGFSSEESELTGLVDLSLQNIKGSARDLYFKLGFQEGQRQLLLEYKEPFLPFVDFGARFNGEIFLEDSTYQLQQISIEFFQNLSLSYYYGIILEVRRQVSRLDDERIEDITLLSGISFFWNWLSHRAKKQKVGFLKGKVKTGQNQFNGLRRVIVEPKFEISFTVPLVGKRFFYHQKIELQGKAPFESRRSFLHELGGAKTIRGYREQELLALWSTYANLEIQYYLNASNHLFVFYDPAWIYLRPQSQVLGGYGFGLFLAYQKKWGLQLSLGWNPQRGLANGLLNLILQQDF